MSGIDFSDGLVGACFSFCLYFCIITLRKRVLLLIVRQSNNNSLSWAKLCCYAYFYNKVYLFIYDQDALKTQPRVMLFSRAIMANMPSLMLCVKDVSLQCDGLSFLK